MITNKWIENGGDYSDALDIRKTVFVDEQHCPIDIERDQYDKTAIHVVLYEGNKAVGCGRIIVMKDYFKLGRIAVLKEERGKHYGDMIVRLLLFKSFNMGAPEVRLGSQLQATGFYEKFGFESYGENYLEGGIAHQSMRVFVETVKYPSSCKG
jgi:predicted GNAT family N-acyltransferase